VGNEGKAMNNRTYYSREAEERAARDKGIATLLFLALGLGIGTALALLFAPTSGKKAREEISNVAEDAISNGREAVAPTLKRLEKEFADLRKQVNERIGDIRS
jgi:gas vesicle protein